VALAALNLLDVHSSLGRGEANPLFRNSSGHFATGKAVAIKSAITGGFFASQLLLVRTHPEKNYYQSFTLANTAAVAGLGGVVAHNYRLPAPLRRPEAPVVPAHLAPAP
jgi:hypothetical protein